MNKKCEHLFRMFSDSDSKGYLTFYCQKCLKLVKIEKNYSVKSESDLYETLKKKFNKEEKN